MAKSRASALTPPCALFPELKEISTRLWLTPGKTLLLILLCLFCFGAIPNSAQGLVTPGSLLGGCRQRRYCWDPSWVSCMQSPEEEDWEFNQEVSWEGVVPILPSSFYGTCMVCTEGLIFLRLGGGKPFWLQIQNQLLNWFVSMYSKRVSAVGLRSIPNTLYSPTSP